MPRFNNMQEFVDQQIDRNYSSSSNESYENFKANIMNYRNTIDCEVKVETD